MKDESLEEVEVEPAGGKLTGARAQELASGVSARRHPNLRGKSVGEGKVGEHRHRRYTAETGRSAALQGETSRLANDTQALTPED